MPRAVSSEVSSEGSGVLGRAARRRFVASTVIDAVGSGLWVPFALLFLVHGRGLGLVEAGAALTAGGLVGLASVPFVGAAADRIGFGRVLVAGNVLRFGCFLCYPFVSAGWQVVVPAAAVSVGDRLFWTANAPLVAASTTGRDAEKVLGAQTVARFAGAGVGAACVAVLPGAAMFDLLAVANAVSFAVAALLPVGLKVPAAEPVAVRAGWRALLRDRPYVAFCATHVVFAPASVAKFTVLPLVVFDVLRGPQWTPGVAVAVGTVVIVVGQRPITAFVSRWSRGSALVAGAALFAVSFAALAPLTVVPLPVATVVVLGFSVVVSVAEAVFAPAATAAAAAAAPPHLAGRASGLFQLSWGVAGAAAPVLLAGLLGAGNAVLWSVLAVLCAAAVPAVLRLRSALPAGALG